MDQLLIDTTFVSHPEGKIFIKYWKNPQAHRAPIILFHESLGSVAQWRDFPEHLAQATGRSVFAYDRIGFGQSTGRTGLVKADFIYTEAKHSIPLILKHFGLTQFVVMGHSIGGGFAAGTAIQFPECQALILESIMAQSDEHMRQGVILAQQAFQQPKWFERIARYHAEKAQSVLDAWTTSWLSDELRDWSIVGEIEKIQCPTLIIHPENDEYAQVNQADAIVKALKAPYTLALIPECGHVPHQEYPERMIDTICHFLADLP